MKTDDCMKPDKDCFVRPLGIVGYYLCRSTAPYRDRCPYIKDYDNKGIFMCYHSGRYNLPEGNRMADQ